MIIFIKIPIIHICLLGIKKLRRRKVEKEFITYFNTYDDCGFSGMPKHTNDCQ